MYFNLEKTIKKKEKLCTKYDYDVSILVTNHGSAWRDREIVPKSYYGRGSKAIFEGIEVVIPEKYHEYLTAVYGDYMKLPPESERIGHHHCTVINLDRPYKEYV